MAVQDFFLWGAGGSKKTPEQIAREREIADSILARAGDTSPVGHWSQGAARVVDALGGVLKERRAIAGEKDIADTNKGLIANLLSGSAYPSSVAAGGSPTAPAATGVPSGAQAADIKAGLVARGLPDHVADGFVMNFQDESGLNPGINEANPTVPGSRGGFGLYQLTGPRRVAYENFAKERGVAPADTNAQLDFLVSELQGPEAAAAKSIFAAPDSGTAAAAIAKNFLRPAQEHLDSRIAKYTSGQGQPVQVASLDPAIGMAQQGNVGAGQVPAGAGGQPVLDVTQIPQLSSAAGLPFQGAPQANPVAQALIQGGGAQLSPQGMAAHDQALGGILAGNQPQQIAQAGGQGQNYFPPAPDANRPDFTPQQSQGINPAILEALTSPQATPQTQRMAALLLDQQQRREEAAFEAQQKASDPMRRLQLEKGQLELDALRNPGVDGVAVGNKIVDRKTGKVIYDAPETPNLPAGVQEYEYAKGQGFPGTFQDWEASKKGGMSLQVDPATGAVTFQQGGNIKPLTEGQSKDATFVTRAKGSLPNLDKYADALTKFGAGIAANTPVFGNYMKSSEYQQAEQAGKEFLQAILRKDTGAAITKEETGEYGTVYLPQPGDSAATLAQKKASRARAVEAIEAGMTPQAILASETALKQQPSAPSSEEVPLDDLLKKYGG